MGVLLGKFVGLELVLVAVDGEHDAGGMINQIIKGYYNFEIGQYLQILFGIQLLEYLLFAALAFPVERS